MKGKIPFEHWPVWLRKPQVTGVFVGGCVERGVGSRFRAKAHAHTSGAFKGWICYLSEKRLPSREIGLHELAHIISESGHTDKWRSTLIALGGTLDEVYENGKLLLRSYHKQARKQVIE